LFLDRFCETPSTHMSKKKYREVTKKKLHLFVRRFLLQAKHIVEQPSVSAVEPAVVDSVDDNLLNENRQLKEYLSKKACSLDTQGKNLPLLIQQSMPSYSEQAPLQMITRPTPDPDYPSPEALTILADDLQNIPTRANELTTLLVTVKTSAVALENANNMCLW